MAAHQRYVRPRTALEGLCVTAGCPHEAVQVVEVVLGGAERRVTMCAQHARAFAGRSAVAAR